MALLGFSLTELLNPLYEFLKCLLLFALGLLEWLLITLVNLLIFSLSGLLDLIMLIFQELVGTVSYPAITLPSVFAEINYFFPLNELLTALALVVTIVLVWPIIRVMLLFIRAI